MASTLRKCLLLGAGAALPLALAACGSDPRNVEETRLDGSERMSRPALAGFAPTPRGDNDETSGAASGRAIERLAPLRSATLAHDLADDGGGGPAAWPVHPTWATADPLPLADEPWEGDAAPDLADGYYPEPAPAPEPGVSAGYIVASLFEAVAGSASRDEVRAPPPRRHWRERGRSWGRDGNPPRDRSDRRDDRPRFAEGPRHRPPPVVGAAPGRPGRPQPAGPAGSAQSLPRALPAVRVPAADLALGDGGPPVARHEPQAQIAPVDHEKIRAAREAARLAARQREDAVQAASARQEAEERQARVRQDELRQQAALKAEGQRARAFEEQRLASEARHAAAEAQRRAAAEQQARAAREQAENEARMREQRQAQALARRDDPPAAQQSPAPLPAQRAAVAPSAPIRGPAARLVDLDERPRARGKPMVGARAD